MLSPMKVDELQKKGLLVTSLFVVQNNYAPPPSWVYCPHFDCYISPKVEKEYAQVRSGSED